MHVADGRASDVDASRGGLDHRLGLDQALLQGQSHSERLHGRARLETVGQGPVAQLLTAEVDAPRWGITGVIRQRQNFAGLGIQHHYAACLGLVLHDCVAQGLVSVKLNFAVNAQLQVLAVDRVHGFTHGFDHTTQPVLDHTARTGLTGQLLLENEFHALLALVFHIGEPHDVRGCLTLRVKALVLFDVVNTFDAQRPNFLDHRFVHLAAQPNKSFFFVLELVLQFGRRHLKQAGQLKKLERVSLKVFRIGPNAGGRYA